jgi:hypothetical protein
MISDPRLYNASPRVIRAALLPGEVGLYVWKNLLAVHGTPSLVGYGSGPTISLHMLDDLGQTPFDLIAPWTPDLEFAYYGWLTLADFFCVISKRRIAGENRRRPFVQIYEQQNSTSPNLTLINSHELPSLPRFVDDTWLRPLIVHNDLIIFCGLEPRSSNTKFELYRYSFDASKNLDVKLEKETVVDKLYFNCGCLKRNQSSIFLRNWTSSSFAIDAYDLAELLAANSTIKPKYSFRHPRLPNEPSDKNGYFGEPFCTNDSRIAISALLEVDGADNRHLGAVYVFDCDMASSSFGQLVQEIRSPARRVSSFFGSRIVYSGNRLIIGQGGFASTNPEFYSKAMLFEYDATGATSMVEAPLPLHFRQGALEDTVAVQGDIIVRSFPEASVGYKTAILALKQRYV